MLIAGGTATGAALAHAELYADWRDGFALVPNQPSTARGGAIAGALRPYDLAFVAGAADRRPGSSTDTRRSKRTRKTISPARSSPFPDGGGSRVKRSTPRVTEDADTHYDWNLTAVADEQGNIVNREFYPRQDEQFQHVGMRFYVLASGAATGRR